MMSLPAKYILPIKPQAYLCQGRSHCGAYAVKGILSAFGKDVKDDPEDYHPHFLGKLTGFTFGPDYYPKILRNYGVKAEFDIANNLPSEQKINLLKNLLSQDTPVMIRIGNGYFKSKTYNPILGKIIPHWITLWGYDDKQKIFFVYDSGLPKSLYDNVPIGNTKRTYNEILRDWNFGPLQFWSWHISPKPFGYIKISKEK